MVYYNFVMLYARNGALVFEYRSKFGLPPELDGFDKKDQKGEFKYVPFDGPSIIICKNPERNISLLMADPDDIMLLADMNQSLSAVASIETLIQLIQKMKKLLPTLTLIAMTGWCHAAVTPKQVAINKGTVFTINLAGGKGHVKIPAGALVDVVSAREDRIVLKRGNATAEVPMADTDYISRNDELVQQEAAKIEASRKAAEIEDARIAADAENKRRQEEAERAAARNMSAQDYLNAPEKYNGKQITLLVSSVKRQKTDHRLNLKNIFGKASGFTDTWAEFIEFTAFTVKKNEPDWHINVLVSVNKVSDFAAKYGGANRYENYQIISNEMTGIFFLFNHDCYLIIP